MKEQRYYLDLNGRPLEGYKADEVCEALASLLKVSPTRARNMLRGASSRIKRDFDKEQALRLMGKVLACGAQCEITPVTQGAEEGQPAVREADADERPDLLELELEHLDTETPEPDAALKPDQDAEAASHAFERLTREAQKVASPEPLDDGRTAGEKPAGGAVYSAEVLPVSSVAEGASAPVRSVTDRRLPLLAGGAVVAVLVAAASWYFLAGSEPEATKPPATAVAEPEPVRQVPVALRTTEKRLEMLARSVRIWMIQYGAGFNPGQVTMRRILQDLELSPEEMKDGWGRPFRYSPEVDRYTISSAGPDGLFGNDDDRRRTEKARE